MHAHLGKVVSISASILLVLSSVCITRDSYAQQTSFVPSVNDNNLKVEPVITGLSSPTSIAFLGPNDMLVVEQSTGIVHRVVNGQLIKEPLLDVNVFNFEESGMVGIETAKTNNGKVYVFLYYTKSEGGDENFDQGKNIGNRLYRYELINNKLVNPKLLLSIPKGSGWHNGGAIKLGPDGNLYIPVGDLSAGVGDFPDGTQAQNNQNGSRPNLSGGILRVTQDGRPVEGIIGNSFPESLYFAYGIRNSFGIDFDPITGNMWDTENGPTFGDEINMVKPGFNSGWSQVQGTWKRDFADRWLKGQYSNKSDNLVDFNGRGKYSSPEFTWDDTVGPSAIKFIKTPKLGSQYENDIFVSDIKFGRIYHFELNKNRTDLQLDGALSDRVANSSAELEPVIFGRDFNGISDLEIGPDGYLYVVSYGYVCPPKSGQVIPQGTIYKISPKTALSNASINTSVPANTSYKSRIIGNITGITAIKNFSPPTKEDNDRILSLENETHWSAPLPVNSTYIEGSFRIIEDKNETSKEMHAGLVWQEGNNKTYYAFVRPGPGLIVLSDSIGEINCASLVAENVNSNKITIINSPESIYVYHNGFLRIKVPREFNGTDISPVGIRSNNTKAEFDPIKVGQFPQNLSQFLFPEAALTVNRNNSISIKTSEGSFH
jgi:aldose sugar dehydrogenase